MGRPRPRTRAIVAAGALCLVTGTVRGQTAPFPTPGVTVAITVEPNGVTQIAQSYALAPGTVLPDFQYLTGRCAAMDSVAIGLGTSPLNQRLVMRGPWVELHLDSGVRASGGGLVLSVSYLATLSGRRASIPVVMPMAPLAASTPGVRPVEVTLRLPSGPGTRPLLPHLAATGSQTWASRLEALPSVVRVDLGPGRPPCDEPRAGGDAGSFDVRFAVFVATLVLWIPLYFWWARRQDGHA